MSRINVVDPKTAAGAARTLLDAVQSQLGVTPNFIRVLANSPKALEGFLGLYGAAVGLRAGQGDAGAHRPCDRREQRLPVLYIRAHRDWPPRRTLERGNAPQPQGIVERRACRRGGRAGEDAERKRGRGHNGRTGRRACGRAHRRWGGRSHRRRGAEHLHQHHQQGLAGRDRLPESRVARAATTRCLKRGKLT